MSSNSAQIGSSTPKQLLSPAELDSLVLKYLSLPGDYTPNPSTEPVPFLRLHLYILPSSILQHFSHLLDPLQRTVLPAIRNRRLAYHTSAPVIFSFPTARNKWVDVWDEIVPNAVLQENWRETSKASAQEEKTWAETGFLDGRGVAGQKSRLGKLLGDYEEERVGEIERANRSARLRSMNLRKAGDREAKLREATGSKEEEEELSEEGDDIYTASTADNQQMKTTFERVLKERFIAGLLNDVDYDAVDWSDKWDIQSRDDEDRWFQEDEEDDEEDDEEERVNVYKLDS